MTETALIHNTVPQSNIAKEYRDVEAQIKELKAKLESLEGQKREHDNELWKTWKQTKKYRIRLADAQGYIWNGFKHVESVQLINVESIYSQEAIGQWQEIFKETGHYFGHEPEAKWQGMLYIIVNGKLLGSTGGGYINFKYDEHWGKRTPAEIAAADEFIAKIENWVKGDTSIPLEWSD